MVVVIDADNLIIGRLSTNVAKRLLREKDLEIAIVNAERAIISGNKKSVIESYKRKRVLNHARKGPHYPRMPDRMLKRVIRGMLPYQQYKGRQALKRVKVYIGVPKDLKEHKVETVEAAKNVDLEQYVYLGEIAKVLGAPL